MAAETRELDFRFVHEALPGPAWRALFNEYWPAFRRWYFGRSVPFSTRPDYATCRRMLKRYLPGMLPIYEELTELAGGADDVARFLSLYCPPPSIRGCTQAVWTRGGQFSLIRNYDFSPRLCDGVLLRSDWAGVGVIAMTDCLVGALDGMNEHGLAASLAFGGSKTVGNGFGTTMLVRAVLQSCESTLEAVRFLAPIPVHMAYNVTLLDQSGATATVLLRPGRDAEVTSDPVAANHQGEIQWPRYERFSRSQERAQFASMLLALPESHGLHGPADFAERFLEPPLFRDQYARGSGTLYTAAYSPREGAVELRWRDATVRRGFDAFEPGVHVARYVCGAAVE